MAKVRCSDSGLFKCEIKNTRCRHLNEHDQQMYGKTFGCATARHFCDHVGEIVKCTPITEGEGDEQAF